MSITPDVVINTVCQTLKLDRDLLTAKERTRVSQDYRDAKLICIYLIRRKVFEVKTINGTSRTETTRFGQPKRIKIEVDKPIAYKKIADIFQRCDHTAPFYAELKCRTLLEVDKNFKKKYDMVVNLLDNNVNVA